MLHMFPPGVYGQHGYDNAYPQVQVGTTCVA